MDSLDKPSMRYSYSGCPPAETRATGGATAPNVPFSSVITARTWLMSAGTAASEIDNVPTPAPGCKVTPGPAGWLKNTKSASVRTLPLSVTSRADRSPAVARSTVISTVGADSGPFCPLTRVVVIA